MPRHWTTLIHPRRFVSQSSRLRFHTYKIYMYVRKQNICIYILHYYVIQEGNKHGKYIRFPVWFISAIQCLKWMRKQYLFLISKIMQTRIILNSAWCFHWCLGRWRWCRWHRNHGVLRLPIDKVYNPPFNSSWFFFFTRTSKKKHAKTLKACASRIN